MSAFTTRTASAPNRPRVTRLFRWLAAAIVCLSLVAAFRIGIDRGFRDTIGNGNWGRIMFGVGTAISQMDHGGYGYAMFIAVESVLSYSGLTNDRAALASLGTEFPANLRDPTLINAAIAKAAHFQGPFNPEVDVRGSGGDDLGLVDYVRLSFLVFRHNIQSLYYTYFLIFGMSAAAFLYAFRSRPPLLMFLVIASVAQIPLFSSNLLAAENLGSIDDPRFLGILAVVPGLHLGCLMRDRSRPLVMNVALAIVQSAIIVFAVWIRASAIWVILSLGIYAGLIAIRGLVTRHNGLRRIWPFAVLLVTLATHMLWVTMTLHPVYRSKGEISRHVFWHAVFYQLQNHPKWNEKYAASYDFAVGDQMPILAAKKYLLRHPPPDPDEVYLTPDRQNVRVAASEASLRKAFLEFFANDPRFVLESLFIYNPLVMYAVFTAYLSSLERTQVTDFIGAVIVFFILGSVLAANDERRRVFKDGALLMTGGFIVSLLPILLTAPSIPTMGEQFFALLITLGCWSVLAVATGLRMILGKRERVIIGTPHAAKLGVPSPTSSLP